MGRVHMVCVVDSENGHDLSEMWCRYVGERDETWNGIESHYSIPQKTRRIRRWVQFVVSDDMSVSVIYDSLDYSHAMPYADDGIRLPIESDDMLDAMVQVARSTAYPGHYSLWCQDQQRSDDGIEMVDPVPVSEMSDPLQ